MLNFYKLIPYLMDRQDPPNRPRYQLTRGFNRFIQRKRCYDVTLSRQEGSTRRQLVSAQWDRPAFVAITAAYKATFSVIWRAGLCRPD